MRAVLESLIVAFAYIMLLRSFAEHYLELINEATVRVRVRVEVSGSALALHSGQACSSGVLAGLACRSSNLN